MRTFLVLRDIAGRGIIFRRQERQHPATAI
jgi:hypothetical protein